MSTKGIREQGSAVDMSGRTGRWGGLVVAFLGILLGAATGLHAQGVRYDNIVLGPRGGPVASATVAVCSAAATTSATPCSPLATIYSDEALQQPMANPFQADSLGNYGFWAAPGHYIVQIYGTGVTTRVMNVFLPCDPSNCSMSNATFSSITAGTLNLTGGLTVNGRSVATEPKAGDAVMYVSPNGNDSADGLSWGTAKQTLYAAVSSLETTVMNGGWSGGTLYVADNVSCGGPVTGQGLWLYRNKGNSPGTGWIYMASALNIVGVGTTHWGSNSPGPQVQLNCGSSTQPALELSYINAPLRISNLMFSGSMGLDVLGNSSTVTFDNDAFAVSSGVATNGPAVLIGTNSFWLYFRHCTFQANTNSGKATDGSDATEAFVVDPGSTNTSANLIFVDESIINDGDLKYVDGNTANSLYVNGLTSEGEADGKGAVWIPTAAGTGVYNIQNVSVADATVNPTPAVEVDSGTVGPVQVSAAFGHGINVTGPATVLSQYVSNLQNEPNTPYEEGQQGIIGGRLYAQSDVARREFGPVASEFTNLASQLPSTWTGTDLTTTNIAAPDGTDDAGNIASAHASQTGPNVYHANVSISNGDFFIAGVWVKNPNSGTQWSGGTPAEILANCTVTLTPIAPGGGTGGSTVYLPAGKTLSGTAGNWNWMSEAYEISGLSTSPTTCSTSFRLLIGPSSSLDAFAPVFYHITAGTATASEVSQIALGLGSYPDSIAPPVEATLRGHPFAFGGSGDNYFATLDHTALTANRTYDFPDANGTVALALSGTTGSVGGSALAAGACTTGAATVSGATTSMAVVVSPSADPGSGFIWEGWVSSAGTVTVRVCNLSGASATPASVTYNVRMLQ